MRRHRRWERLDDDGGMSLVEVLVALLVLAVVLTGLAATLIGGLRSLAENEARTVANALANDTLEELHARDWSDLDPGPAGDPRVETEEDAGPDGDYEIRAEIEWFDDPSTSAEDDYVRFRVTVGWERFGSARDVQHEAFRSQAEEQEPGIAVRSVRLEPDLGLLDEEGKITAVLDAEGNIEEANPIGLTAILETVEPVESVKAELLGCDEGDCPSMGSDDGKLWTFQDWSSASYRYPNGDTTVRFTISDGEETLQVNAVIRLVLEHVEFARVEIADIEGNPICVDNDGQAVDDVRLTIEVNGLTIDDAVEITGGDLDTDGDWVAEHTETTLDGSIFSFVFPSGHTWDPEAPAEVTLTAIRELDDQVVTHDISVDLESCDVEGEEKDE